MAGSAALVTESEGRPPSWLSRLATGFTPPRLPPTSSRAFRFHMAFTLLYAVFEGIIGNAPLMAVKAMNASDAQVQLPLAMTAGALFASVLTGAAVAARRQKPFLGLPGFAGARAAPVVAVVALGGGVPR